MLMASSSATVFLALLLFAATASGRRQLLCDPSLPCDALGASCMECVTTDGATLLNSSAQACMYGQSLSATCTVLANVTCTGSRTFSRALTCQYCYQLPASQFDCTPSTQCNVHRKDNFYLTTCTTKEATLCLGRRVFARNERCNWSSGHRWSTTFILSLILGGFGADRFYLGYTGMGVLKLLTFGGIAVWTLVDCILAGIGYLQPEDGSALLDN